VAATDFQTIDDYLLTLPPDVRKVGQRVRRTIGKALPGAAEAISYQIPTFKLNGRNVVHFAAWKSHLSLYPIPNGPDDFLREIEPYAVSKGTLRFPFDQPIPYDLISQIAKLHLAAHQSRVKSPFTKLGAPVK
jgi:uncharacterized protein YdhG (YjbR/CyaY superfamily)